MARFPTACATSVISPRADTFYARMDRRPGGRAATMLEWDRTYAEIVATLLQSGGDQSLNSRECLCLFVVQSIPLSKEVRSIVADRHISSRILPYQYLEVHIDAVHR